MSHTLTYSVSLCWHIWNSTYYNTYIQYNTMFHCLRAECHLLCHDHLPPSFSSPVNVSSVKVKATSNYLKSLN